MQSSKSNSAGHNVVRLPVAEKVRVLSASPATEELPRNWQALGDVTASVLGRLKVVKSAA